jgi:hypothetical protein
MSVFTKPFWSRIWRNTIHFLRTGAALSGSEQVVGRPRMFLGMGSAPAANRSDKGTKERSQTEGVTLELRKRISQKNEKIKRTRRQIERQDRQLAELRAELQRISSIPTASSGPPQETIPVFFVVGVAKSGTTWLMRMLDSHPEILCKGEGQLFGAEWRHDDRKQRQTKLVSSLYNALLDSEYLRLWIERSVWTRDGNADEHLDKLTRAAIQHFLSEQLSESGKKTVGDKLLLLPEVVEEIHRIYPEARIIHLIRDGRDQAISMTHHVWNHASDQGGIRTLTPEEIYKRDAYNANPEKVLQAGESIFAEARLRMAAEGWASRVSAAIEDGRTLFGDHYVEVRYEDLLEHPHEEMTELARFLGVETREEFIEQAVNSASFETLSKGRKRGQEDATSFFRKGVAGDWREFFTKRDREIYKEIAGDLLIQLGYEKDYDW